MAGGSCASTADAAEYQCWVPDEEKIRQVVQIMRQQQSDQLASKAAGSLGPS
jgi:hypothetical protein